MTAEYSVRAIVGHLARSDIDDAESIAFRLLEARDEVSSSLGVPVDSVRMVLPINNLHEAREIAPSLEGVRDEGVLVSLGSFSVGSEGDLDGIVDLLENGYFISLRMARFDWEEARLLSRAFHEASSRDPSVATRLGVNPLGRDLLTPYFPLASSTVDSLGVTASLTYPNYLSRAYMGGGLEGLREAVKRAAETAVRASLEASRIVGASWGKADISVSPWMQESSLGLVELVAGVRMPEPGFAYGVALVNKVLWEVASSRSDLTGFNEVQLPVAEDLKLKARVSEGGITARDLLRLSAACLAGLDMAIIPSSIDGVAGLILDAHGYSMAKGRVVGVRIIPVEYAEPGDRVYIDRFGEAPVIPL